MRVFKYRWFEKSTNTQHASSHNYIPAFVLRMRKESTSLFPVVRSKFLSWESLQYGVNSWVARLLWGRCCRILWLFCHVHVFTTHCRPAITSFSTCYYVVFLRNKPTDHFSCAIISRDDSTINWIFRYLHKYKYAFESIGHETYLYQFCNNVFTINMHSTISM